MWKNGDRTFTLPLNASSLSFSLSPLFVPVLCPATVEIERDHASRMLLNIRGSLLQDFPATVFNLADVRGGCEER